MHTLKSLFSRAQASHAVAPVQALVELSADSLKLVAGGLPRVGDVAITTISETELPRVG